MSTYDWVLLVLVGLLQAQVIVSYRILHKLIHRSDTNLSIGIDNAMGYSSKRINTANERIDEIRELLYDRLGETTPP